MKTNRLYPFLFLFGAFAFIVVMMFVALCYSFVLSFSGYYIVEPNSETVFVGLQNYGTAFFDREFTGSLVTSFIFIGASIVFQTCVGLGLALLVHALTSRTLVTIMRTMLTIPMMVMSVASSYMFLLMFLPGKMGTINALLSYFGIAPIDFLGSGASAMGVVVLADAWEGIPFVFLILYAALQVIPKDVFESAEIDGCVGLKRLRHITMPLLAPAIMSLLILRAIDLWKTFDPVYIITRGGPYRATQVATLYTYLTAFKYGHIAYSCALSMLLILIPTILTAITVKQVRF